MKVTTMISLDFLARDIRVRYADGIGDQAHFQDQRRVMLTITDIEAKELYNDLGKRSMRGLFAFAESAEISVAPKSYRPKRTYSVKACPNCGKRIKNLGPHKRACAGVTSG